ncbi:MAG: LacI family transcriptional regulator [Rariglobus sp.]|jgi:DNA-binding LacI/PurR family transcriptional regulator|nr:LacI family transcriptional regulator [Rariglobus sp.]
MDIKKFSRLAGVSTATVSRAFSGNGRIKEATRQRIFELAATHGYTPNIHAQRLNARRTDIIAVYYSFSTAPIFDYYNMELAQEIAKAAGVRGYTTNLELTQKTEAPSPGLQRAAAGGGLDGIILVADSRAGALAFLQQFKSIPVVVIANHRWDLPEAAGLVRIHQDSGIGEAIAHLKSAGHARIGFIHGVADTAKHDAFLNALQAQGLDAASAPAASGPLSFEDGERAIGELLSARVTAVLCSTDILALGAISGADKRGVRVPQDLSIVGIDNLSFSPFTRPPLASVGIPRTEIAEAAIAILDQLVTDTTADATPSARQFIHTINTRFIPRASLGPVSRPA